MYGVPEVRGGMLLQGRAGHGWGQMRRPGEMRMSDGWNLLSGQNTMKTISEHRNIKQNLT